MTKRQSTTCMNQYSHKDLLGNIAHNKLKPHSPIPCNSHGEQVMATDVVSETVLENRLPCGHGGGGGWLSGQQILKLCVCVALHTALWAPPSGS